jgi:hypothetical protein
LHNARRSSTFQDADKAWRGNGSSHSIADFRTFVYDKAGGQKVGVMASRRGAPSDDHEESLLPDEHLQQSVIPMNVASGHRRLCQYRLRTLFIAVSAISLFLGWNVIHRDIQKAREAYEWTWAAFEIDLALVEDVCRASQALRDAKCHWPIYSKRSAGEEHLALIQELALRIRGTCFMNPDEHVGRLATLDRHLGEAEGWLARLDHRTREEQCTRFQ